MLSRILNLIGEKHGSKKQLADYLGIKSTVITDWISLKNKSYPKYAAKIAQFYGVSLDWIYGHTNEKAPTPKGERNDKDVIMAMIEKLSPEKQKDAMQYLDFLLAKQDNQ